MSALSKSALVFACLAVTGCERAPSFDILGSYFPGWLVSLTVALLLTVLVRFLVLRLKIELSAPIVVYPSLLAGLTFALWLVFLQ
jgi:YtcA family